MYIIIYEVPTESTSFVKIFLIKSRHENVSLISEPVKK